MLFSALYSKLLCMQTWNYYNPADARAKRKAFWEMIIPFLLAIITVPAFLILVGVIITALIN